MAARDTRVIIRQQTLRGVLERNADLVIDDVKDRLLDLLRAYAPSSPGEPEFELHFSETLTLTVFKINGRPTIRIKSSSKHATFVLKGTEGGYATKPPYYEDTKLGDWMTRIGITNPKARAFLANRIRDHGTQPAKPVDFIDRAIEQALR